MRYIFTQLLLVFSSTICVSQSIHNFPLQSRAEVEEKLKEHVSFLTSKKLLGRSTLSGHDTLAARYIDSLFKLYKFEPYTLVPRTSYHQPVGIISHEPDSRNISYRGINHNYFNDFICLGPDPLANKQYEIVFGGFGTEEEIDSLNLDGKALFILTNNLRVGTMKINELVTAKGCQLVLAANYSNTAQFELISKQLSNDHKHIRYSLLGSRNMGASRFFAKFGKPIPQILLSDDLAMRFLGESPQKVAAKIENGETLRPFAPFFKLGFQFNYKTDTIKTFNVVGFIPSKEPTEQSVILSAHFDHLKADEQNWYPGADDNASGVAVMLEVAKSLSEMLTGEMRPCRNIVFAAFTGEEIGLLGSEGYTQQPIFSIDSTVIVINLDMVGRESKKKPNERILFIDGKEEYNNFIDVLSLCNISSEQIIKPNSLDDATLFSISDHTSFQQKNIPAFLINTGIHSDYHQPTDTHEKLNYANMASIYDLLLKTVYHLATQPDPWQMPEE
jgi:hypothetical protein